MEEEYYLLTLSRRGLFKIFEEKIYLKIDGDKSKLIAYEPIHKILPEYAIERISEKDAKKAFDVMKIRKSWLERLFSS